MIIRTCCESQIETLNNIFFQFKTKKGTPESRELKKKGETINAVLLSEADYLDQIRIPDFSKSIKSYLAQRAEFHRKQMEFFEQAASQFPDLE